MFAKRHRTLVAALREGGFEDPEGELRRWQSEAAFEERQREQEPDVGPEPAEERALRRTVYDKPERQRRSDIACEEYTGAYMQPQEQALWDRWAKACADVRIEEVTSRTFEDIGEVCGELRRDVDQLHRQMHELRALVEIVQKALRVTGVTTPKP